MFIQIQGHTIDTSDIKRVNYSVYDSTENGVRYYGEAIHIYLYSIDEERFPFWVSVGCGDDYAGTRKLWEQLTSKLADIIFMPMDFSKLSPPDEG